VSICELGLQASGEKSLTNSSIYVTLLRSMLDMKLGVEFLFYLGEIGTSFVLWVVPFGVCKTVNKIHEQYLTMSCL